MNFGDFNDKYLDAWINKLPQKHVKQLEEYQGSSYQIMYYLYYLKDKKLQKIYTDMFKKAFVIRKDLTVYRFVRIKDPKHLSDMEYPFSVSLNKEHVAFYADGYPCCVLTITLPKGTKILTSDEYKDKEQAQLIVEPGLMKVKNINGGDIKVDFKPTGLDFTKKVKLPKSTLDLAYYFLFNDCYKNQLEYLRGDIPKIVLDRGVMYKKGCYKNYIKLVPTSSKQVEEGIITFGSREPGLLNKVLYMKGENNKIYTLYGIKNNKKIQLGDNDFREVEIYFTGDYDAYEVVKHDKDKPSGKGVVVLKGKGNLVMHPSETRENFFKKYE